jgi:DNA-binding LacI/PurR family transcriptional regulator
LKEFTTSVGAATTSIKEVARRAGVSIGTVSDVLNRPDLVSPTTRQRVLDAITELGFVRNESARQLRVGHSRTVGLVETGSTVRRRRAPEQPRPSATSASMPDGSRPTAAFRGNDMVALACCRP